MRFVVVAVGMKKPLDERLSDRNRTVPLEILEIGMGAGANLQFYPENSNLTALDINPEFVKVFNKNRKNYPQVNYRRTVLNMAEDMKDVPDSSFDVVINTHVLCSVQSVNDVLKEVKRVLKPGGKYIFLEHVAFPRKEWGYMLQIFVTPIWNIFFDKCWPIRNNEDSIRKAGFSDVYCETKYPPKLLLYFRPQLLGIAIK
ncbi:thiol S-methyltransferase TMT1B [Parasteatoda tepidariorum]|uniref:thiol S-methyltransferase TMT1B n=1 Tax=Parasteatoda tepidariorum TaxID=114398 RepID=UPI001C71AFCC|nr:methyltransferase-like protein 7B [Parasteatoda tepidariorum]